MYIYVVYLSIKSRRVLCTFTSWRCVHGCTCICVCVCVYFYANRICTYLYICCMYILLCTIKVCVCVLFLSVLARCKYIHVWYLFWDAFVSSPFNYIQTYTCTSTCRRYMYIKSNTVCVTDKHTWLIRLKSLMLAIMSNIDS